MTINVAQQKYSNNKYYVSTFKYTKNRLAHDTLLVHFSQ